MASSSSATAIQGQALQSYTTELVRALTDLKDKRYAISQQITKEEQEHRDLQQEAKAIAERLQRVEASLDSKLQARNEYDRTIGEAEEAYTKIVESSQTLLHVLKRESSHLLGQSQGGQAPAARGGKSSSSSSSSSFGLSRSLNSKGNAHAN